MAAGITWNFAPVVAMPQDIRWGRTYEGYCDNTDLVWQSVAAYVRGLQNADEAWLPGTEGQGVADVLFGDYDFVGKLPYTWPRWSSQLPFDLNAVPTQNCAAPLFPFGFGLTMCDPSPKQLNCPKP
jgi:hypothetical protein